MDNLNSLPLEGKIATNRINKDAETWPNTTFAMVELHSNKKFVGEAVLVGPNTVITFASNICCEEFKTEKKNVGVSWDGVVGNETANVLNSFIPEGYINSPSNTSDYAIMIIDKDFQEKYGYLGISPEISNLKQYFVYAFRNNERKSEIVPISGIKLENNRLIYDIIPTHQPIVGAAIFSKDDQGNCYLVALHQGNDENSNFGLYISNEILAQIKNWSQV